jgi:hypothetical protein
MHWSTCSKWTTLCIISILERYLKFASWSIMQHESVHWCVFDILLLWVTLTRKRLTQLQQSFFLCAIWLCQVTGWSYLIHTSKGKFPLLSSHFSFPFYNPLIITKVDLKSRESSCVYMQLSYLLIKDCLERNKCHWTIEIPIIAIAFSCMINISVVSSSVLLCWYIFKSDGCD